MVKSMTGFGRSEVVSGERKFTVEIKSVNNRYLDVNIRMPRQFNQFEAAIRTELKKYITRGKVDMYITYENMGEALSKVRYNRELAQEYMNGLNALAQDFGLVNDVSVGRLSAFPDVFVIENSEEDVSVLWEPLCEAVNGAAQQFLEARTREGEFLRSDLNNKLDNMLGNVEFLTQRAPQIIQEYQDQLNEKVRDLLSEAAIDEGRILQEVAIYADRVCIDEELVRLRSHIKATKAELDLDESVGRKLDFLAQEMNREANTILSKTIDVESSNKAIELKTEIEKIREQIQNIE